jgi:pyridoxine 5'-phosphate synthase PdxJ
LPYTQSAILANDLGLGNAGHDLSLITFNFFKQNEVSIGHALISEAIWD